MGLHSLKEQVCNFGGGGHVPTGSINASEYPGVGGGKEYLLSASADMAAVAPSWKREDLATGTRA